MLTRYHSGFAAIMSAFKGAMYLRKLVSRSGQKEPFSLSVVRNALVFFKLGVVFMEIVHRKTCRKERRCFLKGLK